VEHIYRLIARCPDNVGIVAGISNFISGYGGWIIDAQQYADSTSGYFFLRYSIKADSLPFDLSKFKNEFESVARSFKMQWNIHDNQVARKTVIMVSKESHCLADLLQRWQSKELFMDIPCVISNHSDLRGLVEYYNIPFYHIPVKNKSEHFSKVECIIDKYQANAIVLARYMQIIPTQLCDKYSGKLINIHHSFLPSFVGAKPYHQASERGVKLIGATCHYVTSNLDEGPIIDQDIIRITHQDSINDLVRKGRDIEKLVLARGLRNHLENRVLIQGNKTIVF
jgi:formyltetrahydrofolate deformylase